MFFFGSVFFELLGVWFRVLVCDLGFLGVLGYFGVIT